MRVYYRLQEQDDIWTAESLELDARGRGRSPHAAVDDLVRTLTERFTHVEAMAPPSRPGTVDIEPVQLPEAADRDRLGALVDRDSFYF